MLATKTNVEPVGLSLIGLNSTLTAGLGDVTFTLLITISRLPEFNK